jgi:hypothetical protein
MSFPALHCAAPTRSDGISVVPLRAGQYKSIRVRDFTTSVQEDREGSTTQRRTSSALAGSKAGGVRRREGAGLSDCLTLRQGNCPYPRASTSFNGNKPTDTGEWHRSWLQSKLGERYQKA